MPRRLLVVPVYNEGATVAAILEAAWPQVDRMIVVDDGSTDDSAQWVSAFAAGRDGVEQLRLRQNQGMSGALLAGFCRAWCDLQSGALHADDWVITMDADGQHRPEEISALVTVAEARGVDLALGCRDFRHYPRFKRVGNWGLSLWATCLSGHHYYDVECGFRVFRAALLPDLVRFFTGHRYGCAQEIAIITARRGWSIDNTHVVSVPLYRTGTRVRDGLTNIWMGLTAWWRVTTGRGNRLPERVYQVLQAADVVGCGVS